MKTERQPPRGAAEPGGEGEGLLRGIGVSMGIAIGLAHVVDMGAPQVPDYALQGDEVDGEVQRFRAAAEKAQRQLRKLKTKAAALPETVAEDAGFLLDAHMAMLSGSRLIRGVESRIRDHRRNAEAAVQAEITGIAQSFAAMEDAYLAGRAADVREVGQRLIRNLMQRKYQAFSAVPPGCIILAEDLTPADAALLDPGRVAGFATVLGGAEGHTAIMARSLGIPAVLGAVGLLRGVRSGDMVVVDGTQGRVCINPPAEELAEYRRRRDVWRAERLQLKAMRRLPAISRDGTEIALHANLELPRDVDGAVEAGAVGIGLLRTEFMFMNRDTLPDEDEQTEILRCMVEKMDGRPVTARTLDIGGEKIAHSLRGHFSEPANPALGLRAIRLSLKEPRLLETQLAAMLRAGAHGPLRILLPMISSVDEVRRVREVMATVVRRLRRRGVKIAHPLPKLGIMIEIPGAALSADGLAPYCDFFAIGTNDLIQYTLAIDRGDEQVAHLYNPLHPSVLRLIQFATEAALRARIPVSVCGEMAGDPRYTALLLGLGLRELSMAPAHLPLVKRRLRAMDVVEASRRVRVIMDQTDSGRIASLLDDFNDLAR